MQTVELRTHVSISLVGFCRVRMHSIKFRQCGTFISPIALSFSHAAAVSFDFGFGIIQQPLRDTMIVPSVPWIDVPAPCPANIGIGLHVRLS
jgi:hypothetical protein